MPLTPEVITLIVDLATALIKMLKESNEAAALEALRVQLATQVETNIQLEINSLGK